MKIQEAVKILEQHNKWRKGKGKVDMTSPRLLSEAIDTCVGYVKVTFNKI